MVSVELSIIIVNWNGLHLLEQCLASLSVCPPKVEHEIIIVDNASTDDSREWLRERASLDHRIKIIENEVNLGFAKANNIAFRKASGAFFLLLNSDTVVKEGAIDILLEGLKSDPSIGACGPKLLNPDGSLQVSVWRNPPTPLELLISGLRLYKLIPKKWRGRLFLGPHWDHSTRREVRFLSGAALLVRKEVVENVGGLDEKYHMYHEDVEWCLRIHRAGWKMVFEPRAEIVHYGGQSSKKRWGDLDAIRVRTEASLMFQYSNLPRWHYISNMLAQTAVLLCEAAWRRIKGKPRADVELALKLHLGYLWDHLTNRRRNSARA
ncbi:MAG: glycosyltransferase family 2 protein [Pyrinomonas sp.]|uniref:glycosyltransferase family 2 protein n=1 Tax=Pyrinomonas sp. TaxID=2080306 RepID=UPI00332DDEB2